ncbi:hypothetical protein MBLNU230_g2102t1 [Neophaeotheca triangularis]
MAAVQPSQGMPQQQGQAQGQAQGQGQTQGKMMQGNSILPPGMSKEHVQGLYQKYQMMKAQGVPETDPEFVKARSILQNIQQKTEMLKRQQAAMRNQQLAKQQQAMAQQQNGGDIQTQPNGGPSSIQTGTDGQLQSMGMNGGPQAPPQQPSTNTGLVPLDGTNDSAFSKDQVTTLRAQITAFTHLQKNLPIPASVQERISASQQDQKPSTMSEGLSTAERMLDGATSAGKATPGVQSESKPRHRYETFADPHSLLLKNISYADHTHRPYRPMIPSIMPLGIDPERAREEREMIVYNRVNARKQELENLPANIGAWDTSKADMATENSQLKLKALIEFKALTLLPKQRALRQQISRDMLNNDNLAMTANRSMYRRVKKQSLREARITEKLEKQQRDAAENKEKKKHGDYLRSIIHRAGEFAESRETKKARQQKLGRMMQLTHNNIEKEEQKRIERTAKQRLQALKANDEETYLKLLGQAKDSRISHLLKQTDGFLNQLAASVKEQQRSQGRHFPEDEPEPEDEPQEAEDGEDGGKVDYYEVAHRVKEPVVEQSSNLVGGSLKEYQLKGLQWMISLYNNNLNGILADEMGLGKTIQTISLITYLIEKKKQQGPFLVIVPLSTLTNWNNEFEKWAPSVQRIVYKGPPTQRKTQQNRIRFGQFQVLLTTYEFIIKDRPVLSKVKWLHMIVDEGHRMKNAGSKLSSTITQYYHTRYRLILTGTPLQNNLPELWALLNFVLPTIFKSVKSFDEWFNTPFANTGGQDKIDLTEEEQLLVIRRLHKVLRPFLLRRLKKDVEKDLPDKQERVIKCNFSALQKRLYSSLLHHNRIMVSDGKGSKTGMRGLSNMLMQLRKLCNHPFVFEQVEEQMNPDKGTNDMIWRTAGKFELLDRILPKFRATGHRVLMFFQMTQIMNIMEDFLRLRGLAYLRLDGATKADDRSDLLREFNAPDSPYFCFLLSTRAGGLGLNLQTADTVIIFDSDWNPHQDLQAQDRAHRIGQKNEVRILRLISSNSVEEKILERAQFKLDMDGKVIQAGKFDNKSTNEERDEMLRVMLESAEAAEALEQDEMDDDDLNTIMMRSDDELITFQKMDEELRKNAKYGPDKKYPRLLTDAELPDLYTNEEGPVEEHIEAVYGRGTRERQKVKYDDGLSEEQWLEAVDNDEDSIEDAIARKQARISKRATNKESKLRTEYGLGDSPPASASRVSSESPAPKKRGRKPGKPNAKRNADDASLDSPAEPPKKRGRGPAKVVETLSKDDRATLQSILDNVYDSLQDLEEVSKDKSLPPRGIIDPFLGIPPRNQYPDYHQLIPNPISMAEIEKKINKKQYQNLRSFRQDIALMCANCRQYNEDTSTLYQDANLIERSCDDKLREETANHPEWQDFNNDDKSSMAEGGSTRQISAAGTPQPQRSGFKLKLNGARSNGTPRGGSKSRAASDDEE